MLKLFLKMLPEPLLSYELYPSYIALQGSSFCRCSIRCKALNSILCSDTFDNLKREKNEEETAHCRQEYIASLVTLLKQLPKANLDLLFTILKFCNKLRYANPTNPMAIEVKETHALRSTANMMK